MLTMVRSVDRRELAAAFVGGMAGALVRVAIADLFPLRPASWPWAVFLINVSGAFMLGYVVVRLAERLPLSTYRRPFVGTGFCGAYTTFATMQLDLWRMVRSGHFALALGYAVASITCGYLAVFIAVALARRVRVIV